MVDERVIALVVHDVAVTAMAEGTLYVLPDNPLASAPPEYVPSLMVRNTFVKLPVAKVCVPAVETRSVVEFTNVADRILKGPSAIPAELLPGNTPLDIFKFTSRPTGIAPLCGGETVIVIVVKLPPILIADIL